jgi:solute carrier family 25 (mitochondrial carrier protein), member 16
MGRMGREGSLDPKICPTDDEAIVPKRQMDKQSWEYIIKSGVAGGLAGCAVC